MNQKVTILEIDDKKIKVGCDKVACEGCKGSFFCNQKNKVFEVLNPDNVEIKEGDKIEIDVPERKAILTVFMSLGLPLILFVPFYYIGKLFTDFDIYLMLFGFLGVAVGFLISYLFFRTRKEKYTPTIKSVDKETAEESEDESLIEEEAKDDAESDVEAKSL